MLKTHAFNANDQDAPAPRPAAAAAPDAVTPAYPPAADLPTQHGPRGIRYDFNLGARISLPSGAHWHLRLRDLDSGNILFETHNEGAFVTSSKRFFIRFGLEIWENDRPVLVHDFDAAGKKILIQFPIGTLGDILAWFPYAERFAQKHRAEVICAMSAVLIELLAPAYPSLRFVTHEEVIAQTLNTKVYATYCLGLFFDDAQKIWQPTDFRHVGLGRTAGYILGVDPGDAPPRLKLPEESRPLPEPYVCIAVQSSTQCKHWNNPDGWHQTIAFCKAAGYRVLCIDKHPVGGAGILWNHIPHGAEDFTGDQKLATRAQYLRHAAAFIGLSSGLSWLAWAAGAPVVLISGFTHPTNEFFTPYRVINWHACNSCWNDASQRFDHHDFMWCPRHAGTPAQFECSRLITAHHVIETIKKIPGFLPSSDIPAAQSQQS